MDKKTEQAYNNIAVGSGVNVKQANILYHLAKEAKNPIIEYGSLRGRSTVALAGGSRAGNNVLVNAVDTFTFKHSRSLTEEESKELEANKIESKVKFNIGILKRHIKAGGLSDLVKINPCSLYSFKYSGPVGLIFIDANKQQDGLQAVWKRHWDNLDTGGYFVTHDFKYQLLEDGTEKYPGIRDWFHQDIVPMIWGNIRNLEIKNNMLLIRKP